MIFFYLFPYSVNINLRESFALFFNCLFSDSYCLISCNIELNSISEIELFSIAFENNLLTDRCFASAIEIVFSCSVIFLLRVAPNAKCC